MGSQLLHERFELQRQAMVDVQLRARGIRDKRVLAAMARVPRHEFVSPEFHEQAYEDHPVPIGQGQTLSQPYIVAIMLEALSLGGTERLLEVGTGSGYQTALLAELCVRVYSIERHVSLAQEAESTLQRLGYDNATILVGDGSRGLPEHAPFDAIIVSAAAPRIPEALVQQLRDGARMILPVGPQDAQELQLVRKHQGRTTVFSLEGCRFVPLIGDQGYPERG